ncbi:hypothetical protein IFM89_011066 [Coptis chinensis]|uniref:Uncharacterized protein n=1 Tax=Coptis chinensis TaxID=261450 RepID=A0A835IM99_9MAGN|nr:hypothetical protein IFM89_011066 [Coptis chinensis]
MSLFDADRGMLNALANTSIEVMTNIAPFFVGGEVLTTIPNAAPVLVPAMNYIHRALVASNLNFQVQKILVVLLKVRIHPFQKLGRGLQSD